MNLIELFNKSYSRKAAVVILAIAALAYIGTAQSDEGKTIDTVIIKWAILAIAWVASLGIFTQALIDWKHPKLDEQANQTTDFTDKEKNREL
jgi:hypothetical protein